MELIKFSIHDFESFEKRTKAVINESFADLVKELTKSFNVVIQMAIFSAEKLEKLFQEDMIHLRNSNFSVQSSSQNLKKDHEMSQKSKNFGMNVDSNLNFISLHVGSDYNSVSHIIRVVMNRLKH